MPQGRAALELASFGNLLSYNSPDCPVNQQSNDYFTPTVTCRRIKCAPERAEVRHARAGTPDTLQYMSGVPPDMVKKDGKTYVKINDYQKLRTLFGQLLAEIQRSRTERYSGKPSTTMRKTR